MTAIPPLAQFSPALSLMVPVVVVRAVVGVVREMAEVREVGDGVHGPRTLVVLVVTEEHP